MLLVYCFDKSGYHSGGTLIKDDVKSLAKAIMYFGSKGDLMITDMLDLPVCSTFGTFIDRWEGNSVAYGLQDLTAELVPMQMENKIPKKLDFIFKDK